MSSITTPSSDAERGTLTALYEATDGPNWRIDENWLSSADIGEWYGVTTDADGSVIELVLDGNWLSGEIPPELGNLAKLRELTIRKNRLSGEIPPELGFLANLEVLDLYVNELSGEIPRELGSLTNLRKLDLGHNQLSGEIPPELGNLTNLEDLKIGINAFTGEIPPELGDLTGLRRMDLGGNQLSGRIPPELGSLGNLVLLRIVANRLSGEIPPELGNLTKVVELNLDHNKLSGQIPPELENLGRLLELGLGGNLITGCIPDSLRIQYYLADNLNLQFCAPSPVPAVEIGGMDVADYIGPNTEYIDPAMVALLYGQVSDVSPSATVRLGIGQDPQISTEPALDAFIEAGGGTPDGKYIWLVPIGLVPSIICRPDVRFATIVDSDGTPNWEHRETPYPNLSDDLIDVVVAHQGGMPENQAALYAFLVSGNSVGISVNARDAETEGGIRAWLAERNIYAVPNNSGGSHHVRVLLPVSQISLLAQQFPDTYLDGMTLLGQGLPMLRSQWPLETLHFEKSLTQGFLNPDTVEAQDERGKGLTPCSSATKGR